MGERTAFDPFEQRIAAALERQVAAASDPRSPAAIADAAMRPRGVGVRVRNRLAPRHYLLLGIAAVLLVPAAYAGALALRQQDTPPAPVLPAPSDGASPTADPGESAVPGPDALAILVRRHEGDEPGITVFAVRSDGSEAIVRTLPDTLAPVGRWQGWGAASGTGWLALAVDGVGPPWPVVLLDLSDPQSEPWVVDEADIGGIGPRWGATGLLAAPAAGRRDSLVIADPATRTTRSMPLQGYGLVGGGPSIVWSADGTAIVGAGAPLGGGDGYVLLPLDGGAPRADVGPVSDPFGRYGPAMASLELCDMGVAGCADSRVDRFEIGGATRTVWRQDGPDRALVAAFGSGPDDYWISVDHGGGRQVQLVHVVGRTSTVVATVNRDAGWADVGAPTEIPGGSGAQLWVSVSEGSVLVPVDGGAATIHDGDLAGFADAGKVALASGFEQTGSPTPTVGEVYRLPSLEELVAQEQAINPGVVLGSASHDAVAGDATVSMVRVPYTGQGGGAVYLECRGPSNVTVTGAGEPITSPCLRSGAYSSQVRGGSVSVTAAGDTSWRVFVYSP